MPSADLTHYALRGYQGHANIHLATSPCWYAHKIGERFCAIGFNEPKDIRMGRGDSIWASGKCYAFMDIPGRGLTFREKQ